MPFPPSYTKLAVAAWLCATAIAAAQPQPDDAGESVATAGVLHVGINQCSFDYRLPRALDADVWSFTTQPGKLYTSRSYPIDDTSESLAAFSSSYTYYPFAYHLSDLGFDNVPTWTRGDGRDLLFNFRGLARADGSSVRYAIEITETPDAGDPDGDDLAHATPLALESWHAGSISPPRPPYTTYPYQADDLDAFTFTFENRGIYRIEIDNGEEGATTASAVFKGIAERVSPTATSAMGGNSPDQAIFNSVEFRGSGTAWFTVTAYANATPSIPYRVRVIRTGTAPLDDHGDSPAQATTLTPGPHATRVNLTTTVSIPGSTTRIADQDWFAVPTVTGHSYQARVERAGVALNATTLLDVLAEDGGRHADAGLNFHQAVPNTNLLASIRFRGRAGGGGPVRFGLAGTGTATVTVIDQGTVTDDLGDPLTGPAILSMDHPTITGRLENPRDIDSFTIEPPAAPGQYRINYTIQGTGYEESGFLPGVALTMGATATRSVAFHAGNSSVALTRRTDGQADSFPARLDMLCKPWPTTVYPLIGPTITYALTLVYVGPLPVTPPPPQDVPDEAPSTAAGAETLQPGEHRSFVRQGEQDNADTVMLNLQAGHVYRTYSAYYAGEITSPRGRRLTTDPDPLNSPGHQFLATESGLFTQRQDFVRVAAAGASYYGQAFTFQPGVIDLGPAQDDHPNDEPPTRLLPGITQGTADFPGDSDRYFLPYEAGAFYRVTLTSAARLWLDSQEIDYAPPSVQTPIVQAIYFVPSPLARPGQLLLVTSLAGGHVPYQLNVERLLTIHPSEDLPDAQGIRAPLMPGQTAIVVNDRPLDADVAEFAVRAGHLYHLSASHIESPTVELQVPLFDAAGQSVAAEWMTGPIFATVDEVWHTEFAAGFSVSPILLTLIDLGEFPDDYGTGERNRAHIQFGETRTGTLESADDADRWHIDAEPLLPPAQPRAALVTVTDLASGAHWSENVSISSDHPDTIVAPSMFQPPAGMSLVYPLHYSVTVELLAPYVPLLPCRPDIGRAGGRPVTGTSGDRILDNNDLIVFISYFFANNAKADFGSPGGVPQPDGWLDNNDFIAFIDLFFAGCP